MIDSQLREGHPVIENTTLDVWLYLHFKNFKESYILTLT